MLQIVFGTGDKLQAITVTSNGSFVRAAREQVPQQNPFFSCLKKLPLYTDVLVPASTKPAMRNQRIDVSFSFPGCGICSLSSRAASFNRKKGGACYSTLKVFWKN